MRSRPRWTSSAVTSTKRTGNPALAATSQIPEPIVPQPTTPTVPMLNVRALPVAGRRTSLMIPCYPAPAAVRSSTTPAALNVMWATIAVTTEPRRCTIRAR